MLSYNYYVGNTVVNGLKRLCTKIEDYKVEPYIKDKFFDLGLL